MSEWRKNKIINFICLCDEKFLRLGEMAGNCWKKNLYMFGARYSTKLEGLKEKKQKSINCIDKNLSPSTPIDPRAVHFHFLNPRRTFQQSILLIITIMFVEGKRRKKFRNNTRLWSNYQNLRFFDLCRRERGRNFEIELENFGRKTGWCGLIASVIKNWNSLQVAQSSIKQR